MGFSAAHQFGYNLFWHTNWVFSRRNMSFLWSSKLATNFINYFFWYQRLYRYTHGLKMEVFIWSGIAKYWWDRQQVKNYYGQWVEIKYLFPQIRVLSHLDWMLFIISDYSYYTRRSKTRKRKMSLLLRNYLWVIGSF